MPARLSVPVRTHRKQPLMMVAALTMLLPVVALAQARPASHTVKKGDTLWDIARTYLGDPFQWPQIYRINTDVVEDPHWIYPGEVLRLAGDSGVTAVPQAETPVPGTPQAEVSDTGDGAGMELFRRRNATDAQAAFRSYRDIKPPLLRATDFHSSGFLTEGDTLPFGQLLGPVTPEQIESIRSRAAVQLLTRVAVVPPAGASYSPGDTLITLVRRPGPVGYGEIVHPTGLMRVTGMNGDQVIGDIIAVYGPIRDGQWVLPAEQFGNRTGTAYQPVTDGVQGQILAPRERRELRQLENVLFLDIGRGEGVALGDLFEARRDAGPQPGATADAVDELMVTLQVVHVRERTATVRVTGVISPDVPLGTRVKQVARLP
jgi:hypothetical protein